MNIKLNHQIIKQRCGTVSFKRGDSFFRGNKVIFTQYETNHCEAIVKGTEDNLVTITIDKNGTTYATCSCPTLESYQKDCQHIAAVLLAIYEHQRNKTTPFSQKGSTSLIEEKGISQGLLTLFNSKPLINSKKQHFFENREVLPLRVHCKLLIVGKDEAVFGIELEVASIKVQKIRQFLKQMKDGNSSELSKQLTYHPKLHCFSIKVDALLEHLYDRMIDEHLFIDTLPSESVQESCMIIPPSVFQAIAPLLQELYSIQTEYSGRVYDGFNIMNHPLPLLFRLIESEKNNFKLMLLGLEKLKLVKSYQFVFVEGELFQFNKEDFTRLSELIKMAKSSKDANQIPISANELSFFLEKVVPGLQVLGKVCVDERITEKLLETPLKAKLYIDRVHNRLLVGLEFQYGNYVINPLENRELKPNTMLLRDVKKENTILDLMEEGSFAKTDSGYYLQNEELEYEFLYHIVPKLQKLVQIYTTTAIRNRIIKKNPPPRIRVKVSKDRMNWLEFKFEMDGIHEQHIKDVLIALEEKRKYYRLKNGSLLSLEAKEYDELRRFLYELPVSAEELDDSLKLPIIQGIQFLSSVSNNELFTIEDSFREFLDRIYHPEHIKIAVPMKLDSILRDYQKHGYKWMKTIAQYGFGGILADSMGLGKTLQSIAFIQSEIQNIRKNKRPVLIVCPSSLTYNWLNEMMKFTPEIEAIVIDGTQRERSEIQKEAMGLDVIITSYPLLKKDIHWYEKRVFHTVFFDEAQAFKNPITQTAKTVKKLQANHRFALTGTPVENSLEELWSIFHVVFPELFQDLKEYSHLSKETIARRIRPFLLRRQKEDVLSELPKKIESMELTDLLPEQKKLYTAYLAKLRHETLKHLDKDTLRKNRIKILAGITRLRQICCHPALFVDEYEGSSAKFEQLLKLVKEAKISGRRVLIFSQFTKMLQLIARELTMEGHSFFYLDGKTPSEERVEICDRFNDGERDFFLISLKAGGTGLNLTGADTVILYDIWWNPAVEAQAADRAHRMGQTKEVQIVKMVSRGTIEEKMNQLQAKKKHLIEEVIDATEQISSTLTDDDIKELLNI